MNEVEIAKLINEYNHINENQRTTTTTTIQVSDFDHIAEDKYYFLNRNINSNHKTI